MNIETKEYGTIIDLAREWTRRYAAGHESIDKARRNDINWLCEWLIRRDLVLLDANEFSDSLLRRMMADRLSSAKPATVRRWFATIRVFSAHLKERHPYWMNPCRMVKAPSSTLPRPEWHTHAEESLLRSAMVGTGAFAKMRNRLILELGLSLGLRRREIPALRVRQVDLNAAVLREVRGKGRKFVTIALPRDLVEMLSIYLPLRCAELAKEGYDDSPSLPLFLAFKGRVGSPADDLTISTETIYRIARDIGDAVGVADARPHRWRHTAIRRCWEATKDIIVTREFARHANIEQTSRYCMADEDEVVSAVEKMRLLRKAKGETNNGNET